jgi:hypothetical protein
VVVFFVVVRLVLLCVLMLQFTSIYVNTQIVMDQGARKRAVQVFGRKVVMFRGSRCLFASAVGSPCVRGDFSLRVLLTCRLPRKPQLL